jgi:hypothetical protein
MLDTFTMTLLVERYMGQLGSIESSSAGIFCDFEEVPKIPEDTGSDSGPSPSSWSL